MHVSVEYSTASLRWEWGSPAPVEGRGLGVRDTLDAEEFTRPTPLSFDAVEYANGEPHLFGRPEIADAPSIGGMLSDSKPRQPHTDEVTKRAAVRGIRAGELTEVEAATHVQARGSRPGARGRKKSLTSLSRIDRLSGTKKAPHSRNY